MRYFQYFISSLIVFIIIIQTAPESLDELTINLEIGDKDAFKVSSENINDNKSNVSKFSGIYKSSAADYADTGNINDDSGSGYSDPLEYMVIMEGVHVQTMKQYDGGNDPVHHPNSGTRNGQGGYGGNNSIIMNAVTVDKMYQYDGDEGSTLIYNVKPGSVTGQGGYGGNNPIIMNGVTVQNMYQYDGDGGNNPIYYPTKGGIDGHHTGSIDGHHRMLKMESQSAPNTHVTNGQNGIVPKESWNSPNRVHVERGIGDGLRFSSRVKYKGSVVNVANNHMCCQTCNNEFPGSQMVEFNKMLKYCNCFKMMPEIRPRTTPSSDFISNICGYVPVFHVPVFNVQEFSEEYSEDGKEKVDMSSSKDAGP